MKKQQAVRADGNDSIGALAREEAQHIPEERKIAITEEQLAQIRFNSNGPHVLAGNTLDGSARVYRTGDYGNQPMLEVLLPEYNRP